MKYDRSRMEPEQPSSSELVIRIGGKTLETKGTRLREPLAAETEKEVLENGMEPKMEREPRVSVPYLDKPGGTFKTRHESPRRASFEASSWHRWKEAFRTGIIAGAFLGCVCMVLFHQLGVNRGTNASMASAPAVANTSNRDAVLALAPDEGTDVVLTAPALTVHVLVQGPFGSQEEAQKAATTKVNGIAGAVSGTEPYTVWRAVSLTEKGLVHDEQKAGAVKASAKVVTLPPKQIPLVVTSEAPDASQITHWFSTEVSSLLTLTGAAQGEMTVLDAVQSVSNADAARPRGVQARQSGVLQSLTSIGQKLDSAKKSLASGDTATTETLVLGAWSDLLSLYGQ